MVLKRPALTWAGRLHRYELVARVSKQQVPLLASSDREVWRIDGWNGLVCAIRPSTDEVRVRHRHSGCHDVSLGYVILVEHSKINLNVKVRKVISDTCGLGALYSVWNVILKCLVPQLNRLQNWVEDVAHGCGRRLRKRVAGEATRSCTHLTQPLE